MAFRTLSVSMGLLLLCSISFCDEEKPSQVKSASQLRVEGDNALKAKKYDVAQKSYSGAIEAEPDNFLNYYKRATVYFIRGKSRLAVRDLDKVLSLNPDHVQSLTRRGKSLKSMGQYDRALVDAENALSISPENTVAATLKRDIAEAKAAYDRAISMKTAGDQQSREVQHDLWKKVTELSPDCEECLTRRASLALAARDANDVLESTTLLMRANPKNLDAYSLRGGAMEQMDDLESATKVYRSGLKYDPENPSLKRRYKTIRKFIKTKDAAHEAYEGKNWKDALDLLQEAIALATPPEKPGSSTAYVSYGNEQKAKMQEKSCNCFLQLRQAKDAMRACQEALSLDSNLYEAHLYRAEAHILLEDYDAAVRDFNQARSINQHDRRAHEGLQRAERLLKMKSRKNYYDILGVPKDSATQTIRKAYRQKAKEWHPDQHKGDQKEIADVKFQEINEAYEVLGDEEKRGRYDRGEDLEPQGGMPHGFRGNSPFHFSFNMGGQGGRGGGGGFHGFPGGF